MLQMISIPDPSIVHTLLIVISPLNAVEIIVSHHFRKRYKYGTKCRNALGMHQIGCDGLSLPIIYLPVPIFVHSVHSALKNQ